MNLKNLEKRAQDTRRKLLKQVETRLEYVVSHDDPYLRAHDKEKKEILGLVESKGRDQLVEEVAYTWFNRIAALRYMDLRGYNAVRVVSPQGGQTQPEVLFAIKQGSTPRELARYEQTFSDYLSGRIQTDQPDREVFKTALLGFCNAYESILPFLFRRVDEYMALLLPVDLLSDSSVVADICEAISPEDVGDVEIIGWLYQFYISEKKTQVMGRPSGQKIRKEEIPAVTQLFTPHWIVRYMVENSLGRLWLNNRPETSIRERMEYYIEGDAEPEFLKIDGPEEITLLDPACGSGHILTYAFDLLYAMYEEDGYTPNEIPALILQNNLFGIDIDNRAAALAAFAVTMKAREKDRLFFDRGIIPNVIAMEDVNADLKHAGIRLSPELQVSFEYLKDAKNLGSLIPVPENVADEIEELRQDLAGKRGEELFDREEQERVLSGLEQLSHLARRYHCVATNPPYMTVSKANPSLASFVKTTYPIGKADLSAAFMVSCFDLLATRGFVAMIAQHAWMFLSRYTKLRRSIIKNRTILSLVHLGARAFSTVGGEVVQTAAFTFQNKPPSLTVDSDVSVFVRLTHTDDPEQKCADFSRFENRFTLNQRAFMDIPDAPVAYWAPRRVYDLFAERNLVDGYADSVVGLFTCDNERFTRLWFEVSSNRTSILGAGSAWVPYHKGGSFRRWYGNHEYVVWYPHDGRDIREWRKASGQSWSLPGERWYRRPGLTWAQVTASFNARYSPAGFIYDVTGLMTFPTSIDARLLAAVFLSRPFRYLIDVVNPTMHYQAGDVSSVPLPRDLSLDSHMGTTCETCISKSKSDWDLRETSWDFRRSPLLTDYLAEPTRTEIDKNLTDVSWPSTVGSASSISAAYKSFIRHWTEQFEELHRLEEENNRIFIDLYGLKDELEPDVPYTEVTILQPELKKSAREHGKIEFDKKEVLRQFVSYGVGCIFGRYSLDEDGLILANAGDGLAEYLERIPEPRLRPDESGILPITEEDDFTDDLPTQFRAFLRAAYGPERYEENMRFVEEAVGRSIREYFLRDFYKDHVKRYKKRPIYWMIASPDGSLRALIYLHRYTPDTVNRFLVDYLRPFQTKLEAKVRSAEATMSSSTAGRQDKNAAQKTVDTIRSSLTELAEWERSVVRPLAEKRISLDLDEGVKVNYAKLGDILEPVKGLNA